MYRLRLALLFALFVAALVFGSWVVKSSSQEEHLEAEVKPAMLVSLEGFRLLHSQRMMAAQHFLSEVSQSRLPNLLGVLAKHRDALEALKKKVRNELGIVRVTDNRELDKLVRTIFQSNPKTFGPLGKDLNQALEGVTFRKEYVQKLSLVFSSCSLQEEAWDVCFFKYFYTDFVDYVLPERTGDIASLPELFIVMDPDGQTTRAIYDNLPQVAERVLDSTLDGKTKEQATTTALERFRDHVRPRFNQATPALDILNKGEKRVVRSYLTMDDSIYVVVGMRLGSAESGAPLALAGYLLDSGRAQQDAGKVIGVSPTLKLCLASQGQKEASVSEALCDRERSRQAKGLSFVFRPSSSAAYQLIGSSLAGAQASRLQALCRTETEACPVVDGGFLSEGDLMGYVASIPLDYVPEGASLRVLVSSTYSEVLLPSQMGFFNLVGVAVLALLAGVGLMYLLFRHMNRPFADMEKVANTIIDGNFDVDFPFHYSERLPRSMGQSLTIMKAVLLGQPLPEDRERDSSWGDSFGMSGVDAMSEDTNENVGAVEAMEEIDASKVPANPTDYYHQLFREYTEARLSVGASVVGITYVRFVEKASKVEASLRERTGARQIILRVQVKEGQVVLVPQKVREPI